MVIFPKSSSVVGLVTAGGVVYVGWVVEPITTSSAVELPAHTVIGVADAVAEIPAVGLITVAVTEAVPVHPVEDSFPFIVYVYVPAAVGVIVIGDPKVPEALEV